LGLYNLFKAYSFQRKINAGRTWPQTIGTVTASTVKYSSSGKTGRNYWAEIEYSYRVLGSEYQGKFKVDSFLGTVGAANANALAHPYGTTFPVHYNPEKHQETVTKFDKVSASTLIAAIIFIAAGLLWMILALIFP
jgi:hypothetical protein